MMDITTGTGNFIANGVVSHNCFARKTHEYLDLDSGRDFDSQIIVKTNVAEVLRAELSKSSWKREHVAWAPTPIPICGQKDGTVSCPASSRPSPNPARRSPS